MGRSKKFKKPTKIVGFRVPIDKAEIFKRNVYNFLPELLNNNDDLLSNCLVPRKWTDDDIKYIMMFFQRNKNNLKLDNKDRDFFKTIINRAKNA